MAAETTWISAILAATWKLLALDVASVFCLQDNECYYHNKL